MTGPFVKNQPALQLLSSSASFSWALQKEAQVRACCVSGTAPSSARNNRESRGGGWGDNNLADALHKLDRIQWQELEKNRVSDSGV